MSFSAFSRSALPCASSACFQLDVGVEVILDRALRAAGDEDQFAGARGERLFRGVLDQRLVDDRQHFLRARLGRRQEPRAAPGHRKNRRSDLLRLGHRAPPSYSQERDDTRKTGMAAGLRTAGAQPSSPAAGSRLLGLLARRALHFDVRAVALEHLCADALDLAQVVGAAERAVLLPVCNDRLRAAQADALQFLGDRGGIGRVDVDRPAQTSTGMSVTMSA